MPAKQGAVKGNTLFKPALVPKNHIMNYSLFRTLTSDWLPCNCCLMHFFKFPSSQRQSIPPHPKGASRWSNVFSQQQRHVATDANNHWKQGGCSKLEKGMLTNCSQMWALTWKFLSGKLWDWESMKELMLKVNLGQTGRRKSLDKRRVEIRPHKKQHASKCRRLKLWDKNWIC